MNPWKVSDDVRLTVPFGHLSSSIALASVRPCRDCVQPIDQTTSAARGLSERADPRACANTALVSFQSVKLPFSSEEETLYFAGKRMGRGGGREY